MKHLTKSDEQEYELDQLAHDFTYQAMKYSDLWDLLPNNEACDKAADELQLEVREFLRTRIDQRIEQIDKETEARIAALQEVAA